MSGGCLESDVRESAKQVIGSGAARLVHYDTGSDDRTVWELRSSIAMLMRFALAALASAGRGSTGSTRVSCQLGSLSAHHAKSPGGEVGVEGKDRTDLPLGHQHKAERIDRRQLMKILPLEVRPGLLKVPGRRRARLSGAARS